MSGDKIVVHQQVRQFFRTASRPEGPGIGFEDAAAVGGEFIERVSHAILLWSKIQSMCFPNSTLNAVSRS